MRIDSPEHMAALQQIIPLIAWGVGKMQSDVAPDTFRRLGPRSRASLLHDLVFNQAEEFPDTLEGVSVGRSKGLRYFRLNDVSVRLHRGQKNSYQVMTNRTEQTRTWNALPTNRQLALDAVPDPNVRFSLVYVPDQFWIKIEQCVVGLYHWEEPQAVIELDLDDWYGQVPAAPELIRPMSDRPKLKLKTPMQQPMEGIEDGTGS